MNNGYILLSNSTTIINLLIMLTGAVTTQVVYGTHEVRYLSVKKSTQQAISQLLNFLLPPLLTMDYSSSHLIEMNRKV